MLANVMGTAAAIQRSITIVQCFTMVERGDVKLMSSDDAIMARAVLIARETIARLEDKNSEQKVELTHAHKKIGFLECKKDVRATEAKIQEYPRLVCEHYGMIDYKVAYCLIYKEWKRKTGYSLQRKWQKSWSNTLTRYLMENDLVEIYCQVCEALLSNESRGDSRDRHRQEWMYE